MIHLQKLVVSIVYLFGIYYIAIPSHEQIDLWRQYTKQD